MCPRHALPVGIGRTGFAMELTALLAPAAWPVACREPLRGFYPAEAYHQDFMVHHPDHRYIVFNDAPKLAALKQTFPSLYRDDPVLSDH
jgi:peptide-methionine (S)-S-oxide reductase